jgi:drug/metabolite transporter (DMT)-like permease
LLLSEIVVAVIGSIAILQEPITVFSSIGALFIVVAILFVSINDNHFARKNNKPSFS